MHCLGSWAINFLFTSHENLSMHFSYLGLLPHWQRRRAVWLLLLLLASTDTFIKNFERRCESDSTPTGWKLLSDLIPIGFTLCNWSSCRVRPPAIAVCCESHTIKAMEVDPIFIRPRELQSFTCENCAYRGTQINKLKLWRREGSGWKLGLTMYHKKSLL